MDAIQGYEKKLSALSTIIRLWGNPPAVPAERVVWLASSATDKKTGLEVRVLGKKEQLAGLWRELQRKRKHQPAPDTTIDVTTIEPYTLHVRTSRPIIPRPTANDRVHDHVPDRRSSAGV